MADPGAARELIRIIRKHVQGDGSESSGYAKQRQALLKAVDDKKRIPGCIARNATLGRCNAYLRKYAGDAVKKRLELLSREFAPLFEPAPPRTDAPNAEAATALKVFISHSHRDADLAGAIVDLLRAALGLEQESIRYTSGPGYQYAGGVEVDANVRREAVSAPVFIAIVTPSGLRSEYMLFELGARWGLQRPEHSLIPLRAHMEQERVPRPLSSLHLIDASKPAPMHHFVAQVGRVLGIPVRPAVDYAGELDRVTAAARTDAPPLSVAEMRLVRALAGEGRGRQMRRYLADDANYRDAIAKLKGDGLVQQNGKRYFLTDLGKTVARDLLTGG
jgi:hypothetical protein